jgi:hypothetical protein
MSCQAPRGFILRRVLGILGGVLRRCPAEYSFSSTLPRHNEADWIERERRFSPGTQW